MATLNDSTEDVELIKLFAEFNTDDRVRRILALGGTEQREKEAAGVLCHVEDQIRETESDCTAECLRSCKQMVSLHKDIVEYDSMLESIESTLKGYQSNLCNITTKIRLLQTESAKIQTELKDKKQIRDILSTYVNQILITPELVSTICQAPINSSYLAQILLTAKKLERAKQPGIRVYPSAKESYPELQKLHLRALHRVRDFMISSIESMKCPQTNIQILQQTVLLRNKKFFHFLLEHHPQSANEVRSCYVQTMSNVYQSKFRAYVQCLAKLSIEGTSGGQELLGQIDWGGAATSAIQSSARRMMGNLLGLPGQTEQAVMSSRGNLFSLAGREVILQQLSDDPILSTPISAESVNPTSQNNHQTHSSSDSIVQSQQKYYQETLFRSHQKLLMDACTAEYLFLLEFFIDPPNLRQPSATPANKQSTVMFDSFGSRQASPMEFGDGQSGTRNLSSNKLKLLFNELKESVMNSFDCIGFLLMAIINDFNSAVRMCFRLTMQKRKNPCLDAYLDEVQVTIWPRLKIVFDQHIQSIRRTSPQDLVDSIPMPQRTHPHYVTRRFAEFSSALMVLCLRNSTLGFRDIQGIEAPLASLVSSVETLLQVMSLSLSPDSEPREVANNRKLLFLINNYDLILSVYLKRGLRSDKAERFEQLLQTQITVYVENQLLSNFGDIVKFVQSVDSLLSNAEETDDSSAIPPGIDLAEMEAVGRRFATSWQSSVHELHRESIKNFTNFSTGMEILKQILTELLLHYTRFQRIVRRVFASQSERQTTAWVRQLVPTNAILAEIRTYSKTF